MRPLELSCTSAEVGGRGLGLPYRSPTTGSDRVPHSGQCRMGPTKTLARKPCGMRVVGMGIDATKIVALVMDKQGLHFS